MTVAIASGIRFAYFHHGNGVGVRFIISYFLIILFLLSGCLPKDSGSMSFRGEQNIINGEPVLETDQIAKHIVLVHSYQVANLMDPRPEKIFMCTGVIIGKKSVLTAAHCFDGADKTKKNVLAVYFSRSSSEIQHVKKIFASDIDVNPFYKDDKNFSRHFDLMVITLREPIPQTHAPIPILPVEVELKANDVLIPVGFGKTSESPDAERNTQLNKSKGVKIKEDWGTHLIIDQSQGSGICSGDSGGPAFYNYKGKLYLAGINQAVGNTKLTTTAVCSDQGNVIKVQTHKAWIQSRIKN